MEQQAATEAATTTVAAHSAMWWICLGAGILIYCITAAASRFAFVKERILNTNTRKQVFVAFLAVVPAAMMWVMVQVPDDTLPTWFLTFLSAMGVKGGMKALSETIELRRIALKADLDFKRDPAPTRPDPEETSP